MSKIVSLDTMKTFEALAAKHLRERKVRWNPMLVRGEGVHFMSFFNEGRVKGAGAEVLREVCALADRLGVTLIARTLRPYMTEYFPRFGFDLVRTQPFGEDKSVWTFRRKPIACEACV